MSTLEVAGVDWAGGEWLVVCFSEGAYDSCDVVSGFESLWEDYQGLDRILIDVPIGLPDQETLAKREELDSLARSVTGFSSSVFPVPSREAATLAAQDESYKVVAEQNEADIGKGLTQQSYQLASAAGDVDAILQEQEEARETVIESHPEVCFRGLLGQQLQHKKASAPGLGERLQALKTRLENPGSVVEGITEDLIGEADSVSVDDVVDALALAVVAQSDDELQYLPADWENDSAEISMRMAYSTTEQVTPSRGG